MKLSLKLYDRKRAAKRGSEYDVKGITVDEAVTPTPAVTLAPENPPAPVGTVREQLFAYLLELFTQVYSPYYDDLHYEIGKYGKYEETVDGDKVTAAFKWTMYHPGKGWNIGTDEGVDQKANWNLQVTATTGEDGALNRETLSVLDVDSFTGKPIPIEEFFPTQLTE